MIGTPPWIVVQPAPPIAAELIGLDAGEREVIALALHLKAGLVLVDEAKGREAALRQGLTVAGTLGVLALAARNGLVDLREALDRLQRTNFRVSSKLLRSLSEEP